MAGEYGVFFHAACRVSMLTVRIAYRRWPASELGVPRTRRMGGCGVHPDGIALRDGAESMFWTERCVSDVRAMHSIFV